MKWRTVKLDEIKAQEKGSLVSGPFGSNIGSRFFVAEGIPVIRGNNLSMGDEKFIDDGFVFITEDKARELKNCNAKSDDIVFTAAGTLGQVGLIPKTSRFRSYIISNKQIRLRLDTNQAFPPFVYYFLSSPDMRAFIASQNKGSSVPLLTLGIVRNLKILLPSPPIQKKIVAILSAYDELIENNKRRIALLEKMAEEIYREWFVRLRFPGHRGVKFEKGFPADWDIKRVREVVVRKNFGRIYREAELFNDGQIVVIDQSRADCLGFYDGEPQHVASPDSPIILFGDHTCKMVLMTKPFSLAENVIPFKPKPEVSPYFLFHLVKDLARTTEYKRHWTDLTNREILIPEEDLQIEFENTVKRNHEQIELLQQAIRKAEKIRNLLLPRLISGKLSVENLDIQFPPSMAEETETGA
jgi:type I restriction enzyme S subunit